jgi:FSR family fosmidomycin resistance protein-like MFS transporter
VAGISSALFHIPSPVLIKKYAPIHTGTGMSFYMVGGEFSRTVGPILITAAISWWGLEGSWRIMPIGIIASLLLYMQLKNLSKEDIVKQQVKSEKALITLRKFIPLFGSITGYTLFQAGTKLALTLYLPLYMTSHNASLWLAGISLSIIQFAGVSGVLLAGVISDRIGRKNTLIISAILNPLLMVLFIISNQTWQFPILILLGVSIFAPGPVMLALVQDTNTERPSLMNSIYMTISFSMSSVMALLVGIMSDVWNIDIGFFICAGLSVFAIPFVFMLPIKKKKLFKS